MGLALERRGLLRREKKGRRFLKTRALEGEGLVMTRKANQLGITPQTCLWSLGLILLSR